MDDFVKNLWNFTMLSDLHHVKIWWSTYKYVSLKIHRVPPFSTYFFMYIPPVLIFHKKEGFPSPQKLMKQVNFLGPPLEKIGINWLKGKILEGLHFKYQFKKLYALNLKLNWKEKEKTIQTSRPKFARPTYPFERNVLSKKAWPTYP